MSSFILETNELCAKKRYIHTHTHTHTHIYIYIYICKQDSALYNLQGLICLKAQPTNNLFLIYQSIYLSHYVYVYVYIDLSMFISIYLSIYLSTSTSSFILETIELCAKKRHTHAHTHTHTHTHTLSLSPSLSPPHIYICINRIWHYITYKG